MFNIYFLFDSETEFFHMIFQIRGSQQVLTFWAFYPFNNFLLFCFFRFIHIFIIEWQFPLGGVSRSAFQTEPIPFGGSPYLHAFKMEPFNFALQVVASNHFSCKWFTTNAPKFFISMALGSVHIIIVEILSNYFFNASLWNCFNSLINCWCGHFWKGTSQLQLNFLGFFLRV